MDNILYTYNPVLDADINTTASIPLRYNTCPELKLEYAPFTYGVIIETKDSLNIQLNNYWADKEEMWNIPAADPYAHNSLPFAWWFNDVEGFLHEYIRNPKDSVKRDSVYTVVGSKSRPAAIISGTNGCTYTETWDESGSSYTLTISHNGPVDITIINS